MPLDNVRTVLSATASQNVDAGTFESVEVNPQTRAVRVALAAADANTPQGLLRVEQPAKIAGGGAYHPAAALTQDRDGYIVPLGKETAWVELTDAK